jgi:hypothetical protein
MKTVALPAGATTMHIEDAQKEESSERTSSYTLGVLPTAAGCATYSCRVCYLVAACPFRRFFFLRIFYVHSGGASGQRHSFHDRPFAQSPFFGASQLR